MSRDTFSRRHFMKLAGLVSAGLSTTGSSIFNLRNIGAAADAGQSVNRAGDYKALICLYLGGGADSFNMIVPKSTSEYQSYAESRGNLALPFDSLLTINPLNVGGISYGLHPSLPGIQSLFDQGKICFINNIGTLLNPINKQQFEAGSIPIPLGLFSHSDQANQWHTGVSDHRLIKGWAGRISDLLYSVNESSKISMNISLAGINTFQSSNKNVAYTINNEGATGLDGYGEMYAAGPARTTAIDKMFGRTYNDPFRDNYKSIFRGSLDASIHFQTAIDEIPEFNTNFSDTYLSGSFRMIAKIMAAREKLGFTRQIFFIDYGGWDTHDELLGEQNYLFDEVDHAISEFNAVTEELQLTNDVLTFSMSEFGRTLTSNGNGTDHAWGGNVFVMGGTVKGNRMFGQYPELSLGNNLDIGGGVLIPTTPNDLYFAELALWFGVPPSDLTTVLPNLGKFYTPGAEAPLGFLNL
ncbi:MAG: DUF1501 domain-containing protein [Saprospiraceae bacterium]|nr:DUF1501 domain-containing protein [Saprospiraceae bacterium]